MEDLQRITEDQVQRTRCSIQGKEEAARCQEHGDQRENWLIEARDPKGSHQPGGRRAPLGDSRRTRLGRDEDRLDFGLRFRRRGSEQKSTTESSTEGSQIGNEDGEHGQQAMRPRFASLVTAILYDKEAPEQHVNFSAPLLGLRSWENKPWAMHGGNFLDRSAHAFFQKLLATQPPVSPFDDMDPIRVSGEIQPMFVLSPALSHGDRVAGLFPELPHGDPAAGLHPGLPHDDPLAGPHPGLPHGDPLAGLYPGRPHGDRLAGLHSGLLHGGPMTGLRPVLPHGDRLVGLHPGLFQDDPLTGLSSGLLRGDPLTGLHGDLGACLHPELPHGDPGAGGHSQVDQGMQEGPMNVPGLLSAESSAAPAGSNEKLDESKSTSEEHGLSQPLSSTLPSVSNQASMNVYMFGLLGGYLGRRDRQLRVPYEGGNFDRHGELQTLIRRTWPDFINDETQYYIPAPQPAPEEGGTGTDLYVLVNFLARHLSMHTSRVPVLFDAKSWDGDTNLVGRNIEAAMVPERAHWSMLSAACGLQQQCTRRQGNQCLIRIGSFLCINDEYHVIPDGSLITFNYDVAPEDGEPSRISLLQLDHRIRHGVKVCPGHEEGNFFPSENLPSSSSTSRPVVQQHDTSEGEPMDEDGLEPTDTVDHRAQGDASTSGVLHMFHRQGDYKTIAFTRGNPFQERTQIAEGWGVDVQDIIGIHPVRTPPSDIAGDVGSTVAITRWTQDAAYRTFPTDVQCLFDVELHSGQLSETGPKIFRHVEWTRRLMTREGLLHRLWVGDYCRLIAQEACLVWHNHALWPAQDFQPHRILAGDYFRVAIPARPRQGIASIRQFLRATENQIQDHTMFPSSPASTSTDRAGDSDSGESTHTQYGPPPVLPEPEPHDVFGSVSRFLRGWAKDRHCHKAKICLHGLCGQSLGSQSFILQNGFDDAHLIELLVSFWACPSFMKVQIYEVSPQPQRMLSDEHHFILEFCPTTTTISTQVAPILVEDLVCGDGGAPFATWFGTYAPRLGGYDDWHYLLVDADVIWIDGLRPEPDKSLSVVEGTLITRCTYATDPAKSIDPQTQRKWPDVSRQFPRLLRHRDDFPCRDYRLVVHYVGWADLCSAPTSRSTLVQREHCSMPDFLTQVISDLWPELRDYRLDFMPCDADVGQLHFTVSPMGTGSPKLYRVQLEDSQVLFYGAAELSEILSPSHGLRTLGLEVPPDVIDDQRSFQHELPDGVRLLYIRFSRGFGTINIADTLSDRYNPKGNVQPHEDGPGIDFIEVFQIRDWLDNATASVQWILPEGHQWHPAAQSWVDLDWWDYEKADEIAIYTDGSSYRGGSSCAAVFWVRSSSTWYFGGYLHHLLPGRPCAHRAELHGIVLGCQWLNHVLRVQQILYDQAPEIRFYFDATSAGYKAFGQWGGESFKDLVGNLRSTCYYLEARFQVSIKYSHVRGHSNDPGNEAADTIAKLPSQDVSTQSAWVSYFDIADPDELHWLWALWKVEWLPFWQGSILHLPSKAKTTPTPETFGIIAQPTTQPDRDRPVVDLHCSLATANVLTLLPAKKLTETGLQGRARSEALQRSFHDAGYQIVGVQETRLRKEVRIEQEHYFVFSAVATPRGTFGMQLWFSKHLDLGAGCFFKRDHFKIIARDPRYLIVKVAAPFLRAIVIAAHAPTSQAKDEVVANWWFDLHGAIPAKYRQWSRIALLDANARVGSIPTKAIGSFSADEQDTHGEYMHSFILDNELWIPSTFEGVQDGPGGTWRHPKTKQWIRGDYVCLPANWNLLTCKAFIDPNLDISLRVDDHCAASVSITWRARLLQPGQSQGRRVPPLALDDLRADFAGPNREALLQELLTSVPRCPWQIDVHTHTHALQQSLQRWLFRNYARPPRRPLRQHMTEATWALVQRKQKLRHFLFEHNREQRKRSLNGYFRAWAGLTPQLYGETFEEAKTFSRNLFEYRCLGVQVTKALRADDQDFFHHLSCEAGEMDSPGKSKYLWQRIRWAFPKTRSKSKHQPLLIETLDDQWLPHFAKLEAGAESSATALFSQCIQRQENHQPVDRLSLQDLPTRLDVERALHSLKNNKATGPDGLPCELFKCAAHHLSEPLMDLYAKIVAWQCEPIQCKGGLMVPIYKKGEAGLAASYRGIMMINVLSKTFHRWLRQQTMLRLDDVRLDTHLGGFRGQQAVFGAQCLQVFAQISNRKQLPAASLFVDIQGAYHFLIRELVMGSICKEDEEAVLANLKQWQADLRGVRLWMKTPSVLHRLRFPPRLIALLREIHVDTWSRLPHLQNLLRSARGSRPGSPLADTIYSALMIDVHAEMYRKLEEHPGVAKAFDTLGVRPFAITWADDVAIPIAAESNSDLLQFASDIAVSVYIAFERRGLLLNMGKNKTALVPTFRGPEAPQFRKKYLLNPGAGLDITVPHEDGPRQFRLSLECSYKHLGMLYVPDGEVGHEVNYRLGQAKAALRDLRPVLIGNKHIAIHTRLKLFESLIISRLCYGISAWGHIPPRLVRQVESFIYKTQRQICGYPLLHGPTNDDMIGKYKLPSLAQRLSMARLSYALRVWSVGPSTLRDLLYTDYELAETSWWHYLLVDLRWCQDLCGDLFPVTDFEITTLECSWKTQQLAWKRAIKGAYRKAILQESTAAEVRARHSDIIRILSSHGAVVEGQQEETLPQPDAFQCPDCPRSFSTIQGLTSHKRFAHQYVAPESQFVTNAFCPQCLRYFWTKARVRQHLAYVPRSGTPNSCYTALVLRGYRPQEEADEEHAQMDFPAKTKGINRRDALQAAGPLPETLDASLCEIQQVTEELHEFEEDFEQRFGLEAIPLDYVMDLSARFTRMTRQWFGDSNYQNQPEEDAVEDLQCRWSMHFQDGLRPGDAETVFVQWGREIMPDLVSQWFDGEAELYAEKAYYELVSGFNYIIAETVCEEARSRLRRLYADRALRDPECPHRPVRRGPTYRRGSNKRVPDSYHRYYNHDRWQERMDNLTIPFGPRDCAVPFYKEINGRPIFLVVHLFSGRRRANDFHARLAGMVQGKPYDVHVLSLDTAIDKTSGNLASTSIAWKKLQSLLARGAIAAGVAGPPCETFSAARYYKPSEEELGESRREWPRPLRDALHPWGLRDLRAKELRQLMTGSALALQTLVVLAWLLVQGGIFLVEHPAPPEAVWKVSLFRTRIVQLLRLLPDVRFDVFCQGDWGAASTKPTGLLALRVDTLKTSMLRWRSPTPMAERIVSIGKGADGSFRTQSLKEYPDAFAAGLAQCVADSLQRRFRRGATRFVSPASEDVQWVEQVLAVASVISLQSTMLPDYQPNL